MNREMERTSKFCLEKALKVKEKIDRKKNLKYKEAANYTLGNIHINIKNTECIRILGLLELVGG